MMRATIFMENIILGIGFGLCFIVACRCWINWPRVGGGFWRMFWKTSKETMLVLIPLISILFLLGAALNFASGDHKAAHQALFMLLVQIFPTLIWCILVPLGCSIVVYPIRRYFYGMPLPSRKHDVSPPIASPIANTAAKD